MNWKSAIKEFKNYLQLERSLAENSIEAYVHDIEKLQQFIELSGLQVQPEHVTSAHLMDFLQYIGELGMSAHSQARILSGIKSFYKYLMMENIIVNDPSHLVEAPKLGRKLPDTLNIDDIDAREPFRHHSYLSSRCVGVICGLGLEGYRLALDYFLQKREKGEVN